MTDVDKQAAAIPEFLHRRAAKLDCWIGVLTPDEQEDGDYGPGPYVLREASTGRGYYIFAGLPLELINDALDCEREYELGYEKVEEAWAPFGGK